MQTKPVNRWLNLVVGALWTALGVSVAFGYSAVLFAAGAFLVLRAYAEPRLANDQIDG